MDQEEQQQELEALQSIYPEELEVLCSEYPNISLEIRLKAVADENMLNACSSNDDDDDDGSDEESDTDDNIRADYPSASKPSLEVSGLEDLLDDEKMGKIMHSLHNVAEENIGMACTFTIVSQLQEELALIADQLEQERRDIKEKEFREAEERDKKKIEGTPVTVENFIAWSKKFNTERGYLKDKQSKDNQPVKGRPTGRQQFLSDATLCLSDVALIQPGAAADVQIDESLFDDLDDLDIDDNE